MLNFQNLLVHIIGLVIYHCLKNQIQVVYIFFTFKLLKMLRWKLFKFIFPNKILLFNEKCMGIIYVISAKQMKITLIILLLMRFFNEFWGKQSKFKEGYGYRNHNYFETYQYLDIIYMKKLSNINFFVTKNVVGFSIYKSYYISEQKTKYSNVYRLFVNEYTPHQCIKRIKEKKTLQNCALLMKVKNHIRIAN